MSIRRPSFVLVVAAIAAAAVTYPAAQQASDAIPVPLSDPARPATVRIDMMNGALVVRGENRKDVLVTASSGPDDTTTRRGPTRGRINPGDPSIAGLTKLNQRAGFEIEEANNVVSIESGPNRAGDIEVRVPTRTNLNLEGLNGSGITVENVEGDIEAEHLNGSIRLTNVSGSVVAESHNGSVNVVLTRIAGEKAMSFLSFNGNVDVTLPASAKANLRLRSDHGDIYTDFDIQQRPTPTAPPTRGRNGQFKIEVNQAIVGAINGGGPEFQLQTFNGSVFLRRGK